jgi:hypothetical protein
VKPEHADEAVALASMHSIFRQALAPASESEGA